MNYIHLVTHNTLIHLEQGEEALASFLASRGDFHASQVVEEYPTITEAQRLKFFPMLPIYNPPLRVVTITYPKGCNPKSGWLQSFKTYDASKMAPSRLIGKPIDI